MVDNFTYQGSTTILVVCNLRNFQITSRQTASKRSHSSEPDFRWLWCGLFKRASYLRNFPGVLPRAPSRAWAATTLALWHAHTVEVEHTACVLKLSPRQPRSPNRLWGHKHCRCKLRTWKDSFVQKSWGINKTHYWLENLLSAQSSITIYIWASLRPRELWRIKP